MAGAGTAGPRRTRPDWGHAEPDAAAPAKRGGSKPARSGGSKPAPKARAKGATTRSGSAPKRAASAQPGRSPKGRAPTKRGTAPARPKRPKGTKAPARSPRSSAARRQGARALHKRYGVVYDINGPRVRLGICWFFLALAAIAAGPLTTALVYGGAAAIAAAQMARCWRKRKARPSDVMAAGGAGLVAFGACFGAGGAGLGLIAAVALAFVGAAGDVRSPNPRLADVGWTVQCALGPGAVALSMVLLTRLDQGSALALLLLVSAYETGDYLIGSGSTNPYEGPAAGAAAIVVVTFIVSTSFISTLSFGEAWLFGGAVAVFAPVGQLLASALLPAADSPASSLRRLDSLLVCAPLWAWGVGLVA